MKDKDPFSSVTSGAMLGFLLKELLLVHKIVGFISVKILSHLNNFIQHSLIW